MTPRVIRSRAELIAVLLEMQAELNISLATIDGIAGLADGYASKVITARPTKNLGPIALNAILGALALKIVSITIDADPVAAAAVSGRWVQRRRRRPERKKPPAAWGVVTNSSEEQPSFSFVNRDMEQGPDVDHHPANHDAS